MIVLVIFIFTLLSNFARFDCSLTFKMNCTNNKSVIASRFIQNSFVFAENVPDLWECLFVQGKELEDCLSIMKQEPIDKIEYKLINQMIRDDIASTRLTKENFIKFLEEEVGDELCRLLHEIFDEYQSDTSFIDTEIESKYILTGNSLVFQSSEVLSNNLVRRHYITNFIISHHEMFTGLLIVLPLIIFSIFSIWISEFKRHNS